MQSRLSGAKFLSIVFATTVLLSFALAYIAHAQTDADLRSTIRSEITADPRSQAMTQAQIDSMTDALTAQAQAQGLTSEDLLYRPSAPEPQPQPGENASNACTGVMCAIGNAFGLNGSLPIIPIALFAAAALFILIFGLMRELGHPHAQL